jgi:hypothetical protein
MSDKYTIETGLNAKNQPVIVCSPEFYDQLIQDCRNIFSSGDYKAFTDETEKRLHREMIAKAFPAIGVLATHPTVNEIKRKQK